jgi:hypothetical protein
MLAALVAGVEVQAALAEVLRGPLGTAGTASLGQIGLDMEVQVVAAMAVGRLESQMTPLLVAREGTMLAALVAGRNQLQERTVAVAVAGMEMYWR